MLNLKNVKIQDEYLNADFYPEDSMNCGHIKIDVKSMAVIFAEKAEGYGDSYTSHAIRALIGMIKNNSYKSERKVMWI